jgi:cell wall-associated NlpC family hydrolase
LGRLIVATAATIGTTATLLIAAPSIAEAAPKPPPPPVTQGQVDAAASAKNAVAGQVGALNGQIAQEQAELQQLSAKAELAEQKVAFAISKLNDAKTAAKQAKDAEVSAQQGVDKAHAKFVEYLQATYMSGDIGGTAGSILTAPDPSAVLDQAALQQYQSQHQADAIGTLQVATVVKSNADAKARSAVQKQSQAAANAQAARQAAVDAVNAANLRKAALNTSLAAAQSELDAKQAQLATLTNQRSVYLAYLAYKAEQARLARIAAEKAREARAERARQIAAQKAARLAAKKHHSSGNNGGGGSSSGGSSSGPPPSGGSWTAAKGRQAADRALDWLGQIYIWAGGNRYGPTDGGCTDPVSPCGTVGFDCSGLVLYAWGANWDHYAATQYWQAGSYHPSPGNFKKGDLLFWGSPISHVAIYIGNGNVVQAPQSGDVVKITPWDQVESGYAGATRPLT